MKALLFDFDGTLVNTAIDMVNSLQELASKHRIEGEFAVDTYKEYVSQGALGLIKSIFTERCDATYESLKQQYLDIYQQHFIRSNHLFSGMDKVLHHLQTQQLHWGIVTNKPSWLARPIVEGMSELPDNVLLLCADEIGVPKPDPTGLLQAAENLGLDPSDCYYLGDAESDVVAAHRAGMKALIAAWGYLPSGVDIQQWQADRIVNSPQELIELF
ncbi:HAD family hydrolase [Marinicella sp. W31]|uniref:HAD family hydrolase n=1 Tax=Marinicella sp. W31 TaxID=3023713 RepID=UPI00375730F3